MNAAAAERGVGGGGGGVECVCLCFLNWEENRVVASRALALVQ